MKVTDQLLNQASTEINQGLYEADLGGGILKKRLALSGRGKRGGCRMLLAYRSMKNTLLIHGYAKNDNLELCRKELQELKKIATEFFEFDKQHIQFLIKNKKLYEVKND